MMAIFSEVLKLRNSDVYFSKYTWSSRTIDLSVAIVLEDFYRAINLMSLLIR